MVLPGEILVPIWVHQVRHSCGRVDKSELLLGDVHRYISRPEKTGRSFTGASSVEALDSL